MSKLPKPRIVLKRPPLIKRATWWVCKSPEGIIGIGYTPTRAYDDWLFEYTWANIGGRP